MTPAGNKAPDERMNYRAGAQEAWGTGGQGEETAAYKMPTATGSWSWPQGAEVPEILNIISLLAVGHSVGPAVVYVSLTVPGLKRKEGLS